LTWNIQNELGQRDRKHRDEYTGEIKRHLKGVETITGETDQDVTEEKNAFAIWPQSQ
jgi:hypothetical protein